MLSLQALKEDALTTSKGREFQKEHVCRTNELV